jgi:hypothetical protein
MGRMETRWLTRLRIGQEVGRDTKESRENVEETGQRIRRLCVGDRRKCREKGREREMMALPWGESAPLMVAKLVQRNLDISFPDVSFSRIHRSISVVSEQSLFRRMVSSGMLRRENLKSYNFYLHHGHDGKGTRFDSRRRCQLFCPMISKVILSTAIQLPGVVLTSMSTCIK